MERAAPREALACSTGRFLASVSRPSQAPRFLSSVRSEEEVRSSLEASMTCGGVRECVGGWVGVGVCGFVVVVVVVVCGGGDDSFVCLC